MSMYDEVCRRCGASYLLPYRRCACPPGVDPDPKPDEGFGPRFAPKRRPWFQLLLTSLRITAV